MPSADLDIRRKRSREWKERNPEKVKAYAHGYKGKRRAREYGTTPEWAEVLRCDPCAYCGKSGGEIDHIVPLAADGDRDEVNLTGACRSCNSSKHARPLLIYLLEKHV